MDYLARLTDIELLALMVAGEADNQPLTGRVAVAMTVMERKRRKRWYYGLTVRDIILRPAQYSTFNNDHWQRFTPRTGNHTQLAELAIERLLRSPCPTATHYHHKDMPVYPAWSKPAYSEFLIEIFAHRFYREF